MTEFDPAAFEWHDSEELIDEIREREQRIRELEEQNVRTRQTALGAIRTADEAETTPNDEARRIIELEKQMFDPALTMEERQQASAQARTLKVDLMARRTGQRGTGTAPATEQTPSYDDNATRNRIAKLDAEMSDGSLPMERRQAAMREASRLKAARLQKGGAPDAA